MSFVFSLFFYPHANLTPLIMVSGENNAKLGARNSIQDTELCGFTRLVSPETYFNPQFITSNNPTQASQVVFRRVVQKPKISYLSVPSVPSPESQFPYLLHENHIWFSFHALSLASWGETLYNMD